MKGRKLKRRKGILFDYNYDGIYGYERITKFWKKYWRRWQKRNCKSDTTQQIQENDNARVGTLCEDDL